MGDREELDALRRLAELESKAAASPVGIDPNAKYKAMQRAAPEFPKSALTDPAEREALVRARIFGPEGNRGWGTGYPKAMYELGGKTTDLATKLGASPEVAAGAGYGVNVLGNALPAFATSGRFVDAPIQSVAQRPSEWLMKKAIKPSMADLQSGAGQQAARTMLEEGINATGGGMEKAAKLVSKLHPQVEGMVANSSAEVPMSSIGQKYLPQYEKALQGTNPKDIETVSKVWSELTQHPGVGTSEDPITVQMAHLLKRGIQQSVGSKNYGELGGTEVAAQKALARYLREGVAEAVPEVAKPLARESSLMNVLDVASNRVLQESKNNPLGLAALRIGDNPLSALTFMADKSALAKSLLARLLYEGGKPQLIAPAVIAGSEVRNAPKEQRE